MAFLVEMKLEPGSLSGPSVNLGVCSNLGYDELVLPQTCMNITLNIKVSWIRQLESQ